MDRQELINCLAEGSAKTCEHLTSAKIPELKALVRNHTIYQGTMNVPPENILLAGTIPREILTQLLADSSVKALRIYIACSKENEPNNIFNYTFITVQCNGQGEDIMYNPQNGVGLFSDFCCKCPPERCDGALLL